MHDSITDLQAFHALHLIIMNLLCRLLLCLLLYCYNLALYSSKLLKLTAVLK